jgi:predicted enzyme related to lactoylglutathione lyase
MHKNPVVYWELASHYADVTVEFFQRVFEWEFEYDPNTTIFELPAGESSKSFAGGGVFTLRRAKLPFLTLYIRVEDIEAKTRLIQENGGFIIEGPMEIPGGAKICLFNEPSGVTLAMIEKARKPEEA